MGDRLGGPTGGRSSNSSRTARDDPPQREDRRSPSPHAREKSPRPDLESAGQDRKRGREGVVQAGAPQYKRRRIEPAATDAPPMGIVAGASPVRDRQSNQSMQTWQANESLLQAVYDRDLEAVKRALLAGAKVNEPVRGDYALHQAVLVNDLELVRLLFAHGAKLSLADASKHTALEFALEQDNVELVQFLLSFDGDSDAHRDEYSRLMLKAESTAAAKLLHSKGARLDAKDDKGRTVLMAAARQHCAELVSWFLDLGLAVNALDQAGNSALCHALHYTEAIGADGPGETVRVLLSRGAHPDLAGKSGCTPLMKCVSLSHPNLDIMHALLAHGADKDAINVRDEEKTPLHYAATESEPDHVSILLDAGANAFAVDKSGRNALHLACERGDIAIARMLIERRLDPGIEDNKGRTAAMEAVRSGELELVKLVWNSLAATNQAAGHAVSLVHQAATGSRTDILIWLLDQSGIPVDARGKEQKTALHWACMLSSSDDILTTLLARNANLDLRDQNGDTALMLATKAGDAGFVAHLLAHHADVRPVNVRGRTVLDEALASHSLHDIVEQLLLKQAPFTSKANSDEEGGYPMDVLGIDMVNWAVLLDPRGPQVEMLDLKEISADPLAWIQDLAKAWVEHPEYDAVTSRLSSDQLLALTSTPLIVGVLSMPKGMTTAQTEQVMGTVMVGMNVKLRQSPEIMCSDLSLRSKARFDNALRKQFAVVNQAGRICGQTWQDKVSARLERLIVNHINVAGTLLADALREVLRNELGVLDAATDLLLQRIAATHDQLRAEPEIPGTPYSTQLKARLAEDLRTQYSCQPKQLPWSEQAETCEVLTLTRQWLGLRAVLGAPIAEQAEPTGQASDEDSDGSSDAL